MSRLLTVATDFILDESFSQVETISVPVPPKASTSDEKPTPFRTYAQSIRSNQGISDTPIVDLLDTAGQEEYSAMRDQYYRTTDGVILAFSLDSRNSFEEISVIREQILRIRDVDQFPFVVIGNKADLGVEYRQVTTQELLNLGLL